MAETQTQGIDLRTYAKALLRRKWLFIVPVLAGALSGWVIGRVLPPVYEASATVVVHGQERLSEPLARLVGRSPIEEQLSRLQEKVKSRSFLVELVRTLDMTDDPGIQEWAEEQHEKEPALSVEEYAEARAVEYLEPRIAVARTSSNGFQITVRDFDPERAALLAQHITNAFVTASNREQLEQIRAIHDFSVEQLVIYKQKLNEAEERLQEFQQQRVTGSRVENPVTAQNVNRVDVLISQATVEQTQAVERLARRRSELRELAGDRYETIQALDSPELSSLFEQLAGLERQVASVLVRTTGEGPELTTLTVSAAEKKDQVRAEARRLVREAYPDASNALVNAFADLKIVEVEERMISERGRMLRRFMWGYTQGQATATEEEMELERLRQEVESNRDLYEAFLEQSAAGQITEALEAARAGGRFEIIEPPSRPTSPVAPDKLMITVLSLMGGVVVGLGLVLASEQGDSSFTNIDEIKRAFGMPILGTVPDADVFRDIKEQERKARKRGVRQTDGNSTLLQALAKETPVSFEFRRMTRKLRTKNGGDIPRSILVTSAYRGEGKTTVAACLAATLAKHYGRSTVIVDCDLRKPRIHRIMAVDRRPGISDALERGNLLGSDVKPTAYPNLFVLPCGTRHEQPTWLLESFPGSRVMTELLERFDHVIVDTAPNVAVPDALLIGAELDAVVFVLKAGVTPREVVARGVELQSEDNGHVTGLVVNNIERVLPYYYDYKYYGYGPSGEDDADEVGRE
jgi:capsular exopolysaccharide synthesis family protein